MVRGGERRGLAGNWNACVAEARTPWVAIFHQDDVMGPGHVARHLEWIRERPGLGMVCGNTTVIDAEGAEVPRGVVDWPVVRVGDAAFEAGAFVRELAVYNPVRCSGVSLNRGAVEAVGGFDGGYRYALDWEFWGRLAREYAVVWMGEPTVAVRWHGASETHRFRTGTLDLEEQERVTEGVLEWLEARGEEDVGGLRRGRDERLGRAYLNRAYTAACAGDRGLEWRCLRGVWGRSPGELVRVLGRPRLAGRLVVGGLGGG